MDDLKSGWKGLHTEKKLKVSTTLGGQLDWPELTLLAKIVRSCLEGVCSLERDDPGVFWLPPESIHTCFVSELDRSSRRLSFQPPTQFRNLWAKSLPDGGWVSAEL